MPVTKPRELAPFLRQLREILTHESPSIIRWTDDGRAFEIHDVHQMTHVVLPKYFKHCKYASFQRQLNYFNFKKWTKARSPSCTFSNSFFLRDAPELMWHIVRKRDTNHKSRRRSSVSSHASGAALPPSAMQYAQPMHGHAPAAFDTFEPMMIDDDDWMFDDDDDVSDFGDDPDCLLEWIDEEFPSMECLERLHSPGTVFVTPGRRLSATSSNGSNSGAPSSSSAAGAASMSRSSSTRSTSRAATLPTKSTALPIPFFTNVPIVSSAGVSMMW
ncbi:hypothetical protein PINS_up013552 [Pythium insidiosum]|nr:hypothetical protein PINS_up013552 [Pythium insidiosum]